MTSTILTSVRLPSVLLHCSPSKPEPNLLRGGGGGGGSWRPFAIWGLKPLILGSRIPLGHGHTVIAGPERCLEFTAAQQFSNVSWAGGSSQPQPQHRLDKSSGASAGTLRTKCCQGCGLWGVLTTSDVGHMTRGVGVHSRLKYGASGLRGHCRCSAPVCSTKALPCGGAQAVLCCQRSLYPVPCAAPWGHVMRRWYGQRGGPQSLRLSCSRPVLPVP